MSLDARQKRLVENELVLRKSNTKVKQGIKDFFRNDGEINSLPVAFACECSRMDCTKHLDLSITQYEDLHRRNDHFVIYPGHGTPAIEKVVLSETNYEVVEKYSLSPVNP